MRNATKWVVFLLGAGLLGGAACTPGGAGQGDEEAPVVIVEDMAESASNQTTPGEEMGSTTPTPTEEMGSPEQDMEPTERQLTYWADVKPVMERNCESCHIPGGAGPYALDTYEGVSTYAELALAQIDAGEMPPWSPDPECRHYKGERLIRPDEVEALRAWIDQGMAEGDEADWTPPADGGMSLAPPDLVGRQDGAYTPRESPADDYHCFLMDVTFEEDTYVTGTNVVPGSDELVHHANLFLINPTNAPRVQQLQDAEPDAGYSCFGDAGINQTSIIGAWVPGATPIFTPDDSAIVISKGSRLVLQVHYNTLYSEPEPVSSEIHLYTRDTAPARRARALPLANLTFEVPPGDKESSHAIQVANSSDQDWVIIGTAPHLHLLASKVKVEVLRKDDELEDTCLVDIPEWDFNWQQEYRFLDDEWVRVRPGDRVRLECVFDNSPENQPVVDGERLQPQTIRWGGKTNDEMCLNFLVLLQEYDPSITQGPLCSAFKTCRMECDDPYGVGCIFNCATVEQDCGECLLFGAQDCAYRYCRDEILPATGCLLTCAQGAQAGGDLDACLKAECPAEYADLESCMRPYIEQGLCNQYIDTCNVEF